MRSWLRWRTPIGTWAIRRQVAGKRLSRGCGDGPLSFSGLLPTNAIATAVGNHLNVVAKPVDVAVDGHPARIMCRMGKITLLRPLPLFRHNFQSVGTHPQEGSSAYRVPNVQHELLERPCSVRTTVPRPKPRDLAICRNDRPWCRSRNTSSRQIPFVAGGVPYYGLIDCIRSYLPSRSRSPVCNASGQLASAPESVPLQTPRRRRARAAGIAR
jgi:hypothetical protein